MTAVLGGVGPLAAVLGDEVGSVMAGIHREKGVELLLDERVVAFTGDGHVEQRRDRSWLDGSVRFRGDGNRHRAHRRARPAEWCRGRQRDHSSTNAAAPILRMCTLRVTWRTTCIRCSVACGSSITTTRSARDARPHAPCSEARSPTLTCTRSGRISTSTHSNTSVTREAGMQFVVRGSLEQRRFLGFYLEDGRVLAVMGLNRGGDPELDEERRALRGQGSGRQTRSSAPPASLADETTDLRSLGRAPDEPMSPTRPVTSRLPA